MSEIKADELEHIAYLQTLEIQKLTARIALLWATLPLLFVLYSFYVKLVFIFGGE